MPHPLVEMFSPRFWDLLDRSAGPDGCWLFKGAKNSSGYGVIYHRSSRYPFHAHRVAFALCYNRLPPKGYEIDHLCGVRNCCNPRHLEEVTREVNQARRLPKGERTRRFQRDNWGYRP